MVLACCFGNIPLSFGKRLYYQHSLLQRLQPIFTNTSNYRRLVFHVKSSADINPINSNGGTARLIKTIQNFQVKLNARILKQRENLPVKFFFFLVGFYCATAFSTVIGQTGDWDILSAGLAVVVVEGIGAVMYRSSASLNGGIRNIITIINYWKAGLTMGLFLDSFKY